MTRREQIKIHYACIKRGAPIAPHIIGMIPRLYDLKAWIISDQALALMYIVGIICGSLVCM